MRVKFLNRLCTLLFNITRLVLLIILINNPKKRKEMGEYGRNRIINKLSWDHTCKELLKGYDK